MHSKSTYRRGTLVAALALAALGAPQLTVGAQAAAAPRAGLVARPILLQDHTQFNGYDVATDAAGNMYIGWISGDSSTTAATRKVRFCTLRPAGGSCAGGIQAIDALGIAPAAAAARHDHAGIVALLAVDRGDRAPVSPAHPGPAAHPHPTARLRGRNPRPDKTDKRVPLLRQRQRTHTTTTHRPHPQSLGRCDDG